MSTKDARSIMFNNAMNQLKEVHVEELASAERKWEFRYQQQWKRQSQRFERQPTPEAKRRRPW